MPAPPSRTTLSEQVYAAIRSDILAGRLRPGQRLRLAALGERHQVSMSVVREALMRLVEQGLVQTEAQLCFAVTSISPADLLDLTGVRCSIEGMTLRLAIEHGDVAWEGSIVAAEHVLANTPLVEPSDPHRVSEEWAAAHGRFHAALADGCGSPRLKRIWRSLYDASELYRRWSLPADPGHRDVEGEHKELVQATLRRDAQRAVALLVEHINRTTRILLESGFEGHVDGDGPPAAAIAADRPGQRRRPRNTRDVEAPVA